MAIRNWHVGKVLLLWTWGVVLVAATLRHLEPTHNFVIGFMLIAALIAIPLALSVITWKWFGGKEQ